MSRIELSNTYKEIPISVSGIIQASCTGVDRIELIIADTANENLSGIKIKNEQVLGFEIPPGKKLFARCSVSGAVVIQEGFI